ncbi:hypothetical protein R6Q57_025515 [Mikania cordata]
MASIDSTKEKPSGPPPKSIGPVADVGLRFLLFATALVALVVMVTSKQSKLITLAPGFSIPFVAKFSQSPAFIYLVAALSVACLYSIITGVVSVLVLMKRGGSATKLQFHFVILDALLLGIMAAATGAAGGVGYIGYKGNTHTQWRKKIHSLRDEEPKCIESKRGVSELLAAAPPWWELAVVMGNRGSGQRQSATEQWPATDSGKPTTTTANIDDYSSSGVSDFRKWLDATAAVMFNGRSGGTYFSI